MGSAGKIVLGAAAVVVLAPLTLIFASGGGDTVPMDNLGGELDAKRVPPEYLPWVNKAGHMCSLITPAVIAAQIETESNWRPNVSSYDRAGNIIASGISQFIPETWAAYGVDVASRNGAATPDGVADVFTPGDAITTQGIYDCAIAKDIEALLKSGKVSGDPLSLTLAAYNAGSYAVEKAGKVPNIPETQGYVASILALIPQYTAATTNQSSPFGQRVVAQARRWLGTPYSWGGGTTDGPDYGVAQGASIKGFDCSSLVQYAVYQATGGKLMLPRTSEEQATAGTEVQRDQIRVGDVIAFQLHGGGDYDHIGIYIGNGRMIHAPRTGDVVKEADLSDSYYSSKPQTIRRYG
ncbi:NlpC/P60 family protein [Streptomyces sp. NPDC059708]|uniref:C40 family peptidase n=1 Tax=Streptomyces sp. NPDC059708 TaxID=3346916 RepID=UPI003696F67A